MGSIFSCCSGSSDNDEEIDRARMRELQAQAAEKRMKENESKGIKNIESVKRAQAVKEQIEKMEQNQSRNDSGGLRWQVG